MSHPDCRAPLHWSSLPSQGITQLFLLEAVISTHICTQSIMKKWFFERETAFISILILMETFSRDWGFVFKVFSYKHGRVFISVIQRLTWVSLSVSCKAQCFESSPLLAVVLILLVTLWLFLMAQKVAKEDRCQQTRSSCPRKILAISQMMGKPCAGQEVHPPRTSSTASMRCT